MPELSDALKRAVGEAPAFDPVSLARGVARRRRHRFESILAVSTVLILVVGLVVWRNAAGSGVVVRTQSSSAASTSPPATTVACPGPARPSAVRADGAIQMVTNRQGWAVFGKEVVGTTDGTHFAVQYTAAQTFGSVDAIDARHAWAVGSASLFGTTDGGASWHQLGEPPAPLVMVHFANPLRGWGVAGSVLYTTSNGGASWQRQSTPCPIDRVCFDTVRDGWIAAGNRVYGTVDAGMHWREALRFADPLNDWHATDLQCARDNAAWVYFTESSGAMSHEGYAAFRCAPDGGDCALVIKENYIGAPPGVAPEGPGSYPGPMSAIDDATAAFVGDTPPKDDLRMASVVVSDDGRTVPPARPIVSDSPNVSPVSLSFRTAQLGWLLVHGTTFRILVTRDGGVTWRRVL